MKILFKDRRVIALVSGLICILVLGIVGMKMLSSEAEELYRLREQRKEMAVFREEFLSLKQKIQIIEGRKNLANIQGVLQAVDEVFSSVGLKDKVKTVKNTSRRETKDGIEEEAEVTVEKVTMNELMNIFYRIDRAPMMLTVRKVMIKQSFENPERLNVTLMLSFLRQIET